MLLKKFILFLSLTSISFSYANEVNIRMAPIQEENGVITILPLEEDIEEIEEILEHATLWQRAVSSMKFERIKNIFAYDVYDINADIYQGNNILNLAANSNNYNIYWWALENNADYKSNEFGQTPIHLASWNSNKDLIDLVYQNYESKKPIMTLKDKDGQTPVFYLMKNFNLTADTFKFFFSLPNVNCNIIDKKGFTPLHFINDNFLKTNYDLIVKYCDPFFNQKNISSIPIEYHLRKTSFNYDFFKEKIEEFNFK